MFRKSIDSLDWIVEETSGETEYVRKQTKFQVFRVAFLSCQYCLLCYVSSVVHSFVTNGSL